MVNLSLTCMGLEFGRNICAFVGVVEVVDMDEEGIGWREFLHVKILLDQACRKFPMDHISI